MTRSDPGVSHLTVIGGAGGTEARYEDLAAMGRLTDSVAEDTLGIAATCHKYLVEPDVVASAALDPGGAAAFEEAMLAALDGPSGLSAASAAIGLRGGALRASAETYQLTDELNAKSLDAARWLEGALAPALALGPVGVVAAAATVAEVYGKDGGDWQRLVVDHPGLVDNVLGAAPGLLSDVLLHPVTLPMLTKLASDRYPHGAPKVTDNGIDSSQAGSKPPTGLNDIFAELDHRGAGSHVPTPAHPDNGSNVDVRAVRASDGKVTGYIVDIPGTNTWNLPGQHTMSANDMGTNVDGIAGRQSVLETGIERAMRQAGVPHDAPVMLVGHSQGGIVAARAANDFVGNHSFNVTHVITAGSPVGAIAVPSQVQMLSLENNNDIVPHLDARENPDTPNHTTVKFDHQTESVGSNHQLAGNYQVAAQQLDSSSNPSVQRFRNSMGAFTDGASVVTHQYEVTR